MYNNNKFYSLSKEYHRHPHTKKKRVRHNKELEQEQEDFSPIVNFCISCALLILFLVLHFS